jgi:radical SAM superfamily enzyme YgiQ (UPF0313 family)
MRVLIVAPTALDYGGQPVKLRRLYLPALTLPALAAVTPEEVDLRILYETVEDIPFDEPWDLVGITGMGSGIVRAWQIADEFRDRGVPVVIGGIAATLSEPEWILEHADALVRGEAEDTWPRVIADAAAGGLESIYDAPPFPIDQIPVPRYELMNTPLMGSWRPVQATRGCPFTCSFCSITAFFEQRYRKRPVDDVVRDVREAKRNGTRYIAFIDDNIGVDWDYCADLWEALIPENIIWMSQCSLHLSERPDMMKLAHASGCRLLSVGIESTNPESLRDIDKEWNRPARYREAIEALRAHGIDISTEMMIGLDSDDEGVFERTYRFVMESSIGVPRVHILTPVPGTPLFDEMEKAGRLLDFDFGRFTGGKVVFKPKNFDPDRLQAEYWKLYERLFSWRNIVKRLGRNRASSPPFMRAVSVGANLRYRGHIRHRITPGIV